ncbi:hypothetical protein FBY50_0322 [Zymomonas mobilis]|uniref:hypothetical protein n=1 Tax=Zymomonas mobilis TaxID=542 RepID=UPI000B39BD1F|nr:hypothetical protein [Zymomonas mobilis]ART92871.1 hypothetical protein B9T50_01390 [Zymomonas mobilis subsp. mobilis]TWD59531.1 hypothetical protein FBY50_0322 [Zymomonas mobilis]
MRNSEKAMVSPDMPPVLTRNAVASTGYPPAKKHLGYGETVKKQQLSHQKIESSAANYLRRKGYVPVCHANIVDITFPRDVWLVGQHVISTEDMLEMANIHGFRSEIVQ